MEIIWESFLDAGKDTLLILPFLFVVYLALEILEHRFSHKTLNLDRYGPLIGSAVGVLPQCGFSVAATTLFNKRIITLGTLLAVYLSTSDEAIPIMLANPSQFGIVLKLIISKFIIALIAGIAIDHIFMRRQAAECYCSACHEPEQHHEHHHENNAKKILWHSCKKTLQIFLFLLVIIFVLNVLISVISEDTLKHFLLEGSVFQPFICALVGLIPTCVPSIIITELFLTGSLSFGSAMAGLCTGAGMGMLVLLKENPDKKQVAVVIALLYAIGVVAGMLLNLLGL